MTTIPTERLREMAFTKPMTFGSEPSPNEGVAMATELLAARDALAALTKERDEAWGVIWRDDIGELAKMRRAIERRRAALAATEGGQGGGR